MLGSLALAVLVAVWVGAAPAGAATSQSQTTSPVVTAQPATGLVDGQSIQVSGSGFGPSVSVAVGECESGATTADQCSVSGATVVTTASDGTFTTPFTVSRTIDVGGSSIDCSQAGACVIGAGELPALTTFATVPIAFAAVAPPAPTPPSSPTSRYYLALGDSLAVGYGAPTGQGYVDDLAAYYGQAVPGLQVEDLGCSGETTTTFRNGGLCPYAAGSQLAQAEAFLSSHQGQVALVTIDIGGDDITGCASTTPPFAISPSCVASTVATVSANLVAIGAGLRNAAGPSVPIVGMTYYDPFVVEWLSGADGQAAAQASVGDLEQLNSALSAGYASFGARVADVQDAFFATDFTDLVSSPFGTIPKNVATACSWLLVVCSTTAPIAVGIHPNATGYAAIASAFESVLPASALASPTPSPPPTSPPAAVPVAPTLAFTGFPAGMLVGVGLGAVGLGMGLLGVVRRRRSPAGSTAGETPGR